MVCIKKVNIVLIIIIFFQFVYIFNLHTRNSVYKYDDIKVDIKKTPKRVLLNINEIENAESYRIIIEETKLYAMPDIIGNIEEIPIINEITANTLGSVLETVGVGDNIWYRIKIPTYDAPMNSVGWVREEQTKEYTDENKKFIINGILIKKETKIYTDSLNYYNFEDYEILEYDIVGEINDIKNEFTNVSAAGGQSFWVKTKDITYP